MGLKKRPDWAGGAGAMASADTEGDPSLFTALTDGERADAVRLLTEHPQLSGMAKIGRYRVISVEPLVLKPGAERATARMARIVIYDYAGDRCVDAGVDLDRSEVTHLQFSKAQPMLAREEELAAIRIALADNQVQDMLAIADEPQVAMQYWSSRSDELASQRRSAAVMFGPTGQRPSLVAVVDLTDNQVADVVPAEQW